MNAPIPAWLGTLTRRTGVPAPAGGTVRVLLVDDHPLVRAGIRLGLQDNTDMLVVGEAGCVDEALAMVAACRPDVVVTDIRMPDRSGLDLAVALAIEQPAVRVLLLSMLDDAGLISRALAAGAAGYVRKDSPVSAVLHAIRVIARGGRHLDATVAEQLRVQQAGPRRPSPLSPREAAVLRLVAQGLGSREIAEALGMSVRTVETHRLHARRKLRLDGDTALAGYVQAFPEVVHPG